MKPAELVEMDNEALHGKLKESRRELYELRFSLAVGQLDDHRQIRKVRLDIARIMTSLRQRELGISVDPGVGDPLAAAATKDDVADATEAVAESEAKLRTAAKPVRATAGKAPSRGKATPKTVTRRVGKTISKTAKAAVKTTRKPARGTITKAAAAKKATPTKTTEETE